MASDKYLQKRMEKFNDKYGTDPSKRRITNICNMLFECLKIKKRMRTRQGLFEIYNIGLSHNMRGRGGGQIDGAINNRDNNYHNEVESSNIESGDSLNNDVEFRDELHNNEEQNRNIESGDGRNNDAEVRDMLNNDAEVRDEPINDVEFRDELHNNEEQNRNIESGDGRNNDAEVRDEPINDVEFRDELHNNEEQNRNIESGDGRNNDAEVRDEPINDVEFRDEPINDVEFRDELHNNEEQNRNIGSGDMLNNDAEVRDELHNNEEQNMNIESGERQNMNRERRKGQNRNMVRGEGQNRNIERGEGSRPSKNKRRRVDISERQLTGSADSTEDAIDADDLQSLLFENFGRIAGAAAFFHTVLPELPDEFSVMSGSDLHESIRRLMLSYHFKEEDVNSHLPLTPADMDYYESLTSSESMVFSLTDAQSTFLSMPCIPKEVFAELRNRG